MKSIAIFLLVGLSLFHNGNCDQEKGEEEESGTVLDVGKCVAGCAKTSAMRKKIQEKFCWYAKWKSSGNENTLEAVVSELMTLLKGCCSSEEIKLLGLSDDDTFNNIVEKAKHIFNFLDKVLSALGLSELGFAACKLDNLKLECLENKLTKIAEFLKALKAFQCGKCTRNGVKMFWDKLCSKSKDTDMEDTEEEDEPMSEEDQKECERIREKVLLSVKMSGMAKVLKSLACAGKKVLNHVVGGL